MFDSATVCRDRRNRGRKIGWKKIPISILDNGFYYRLNGMNIELAQ